MDAELAALREELASARSEIAGLRADVEQLRGAVIFWPSPAVQGACPVPQPYKVCPPCVPQTVWQNNGACAAPAPGWPMLNTAGCAGAPQVMTFTRDLW